MLFPYERYENLAEPLVSYYPVAQETHARWIAQRVSDAGKLLSQLLGQPVPELEVLLVDPADWQLAPHDDPEEIGILQPFWTDQTSPPSLVVPTELDPVFGEATQEKLAFLLYHGIALAFLEADPRPWPGDYPLWADEWQLKFAALWLSHELDGVQGTVNKDLLAEYEDIFEPELDGKTPDTVRSFDWYEDTEAEDYVGYELLLEQFATDLLAHSDPGVLPRFLALYRTERETLLSDEVTEMLATALGPGGGEWLEEQVYF